MFGKLQKIFDRSGLDPACRYPTHGGLVDVQGLPNHLDQVHRGVEQRSGSTIAEFQTPQLRLGVHNDALDKFGGER